MKSNKEFVADIAKGNEALFKASQLNVADYFNDMPNQEALVEHFVGRMVNERMNMTEISAQIAKVDDNADPKELELLTRQAADEAKHYRMVKEVIEHIKGEEINVAEALEAERQADTAKGATLLEKYDAENDEAVLAIKKMEVHENSQTIFGLHKNHASHRLVMKLGEASSIILPDKLRTPGA